MYFRQIYVFGIDAEHAMVMVMLRINSALSNSIDGKHRSSREGDYLFVVMTFLILRMALFGSKSWKYSNMLVKVSFLSNTA